MAKFDGSTSNLTYLPGTRKRPPGAATVPSNSPAWPSTWNPPPTHPFEDAAWAGPDTATKPIAEAARAAAAAADRNFKLGCNLLTFIGFSSRLASQELPIEFSPRQPRPDYDPRFRPGMAKRVSYPNLGQALDRHFPDLVQRVFSIEMKFVLSVINIDGLDCRND